MRMERRDVLPNLARIPVDRGTGETTGIDVWSVLDFLRRRWKMIAACGILAVALAISFVQTRVPLYAAYTEMLLQARQDKFLNRILSKDAPPSDSTSIDPAEFENQIVLIGSVALLKRVVESEGLVDDPEYGPAAQSWFGMLVSNTINRIREFMNPPPPGGVEGGTNDDPVTATARVLRGYVDASRSGRSSVMLITVMSANPRKAARLSDAVARAYIEELLATRAEAARTGAQWLNESLTNLRDQLKQSEEAVAKFKAQNNLIATRSTGATITEQQLSDLNARLVAAQADTAEKRAKLDQADQVKLNRGNAQAIPDVLRSPLITTLRAQQAEISRKEADLVARYGPQHPLVVNVRAEKRDVDGAISAEIGRILQVLKNDYDVAVSRQKAIEDSLRGVTGQSNTDDQISVRLRELERTAAANKTLYEDFLSRAKLLEEQTSFMPTEARILTQATPPLAPSYPKKALVVSLGLFFGLGSGLAWAVLLELLNAGFTSPRQVEEKLDLPVLACLALLNRERLKKLASPAFVVVDKPLSRYSEAIRALRNAVNIHRPSSPPRIVQVTSTMPQEGKSTVALSMALSAADSGQKVLLIDADLRRPAVTRTFKLKDKPGLTDVLSGTVRLSEALVEESQTGLHVLPSGALTKNQPALLGSESMQLLVQGLSERFDLVILDTPPLGPVVDGAIVARYSDAVVFVVKWGTTAREAVQNAINGLPDRDSVVGVVLNLVDERKIAKFGKYAFYGYSEFAKYYQE
ncbi:MAG: polysaccharide biosynthesis tyrosine autokinase [Alsobacter sp.]